MHQSLPTFKAVFETKLLSFIYLFKKSKLFVPDKANGTECCTSDIYKVTAACILKSEIMLLQSLS